MPWLASGCSSTFSGSSGLVKLGHPQPLSNLSREEKRGSPETMSTCGVVTDESQIEAIYLPPYADQRHGSLRVAVRSALVTSMNDELRFFEPHEYENAEAVASRLIATLAVRRAETSSGAETTRYDARIASDVAGLIGRQRGDGGWAWCDSVCQSDPNVTGWVLLALGEARSDGTSLDRGVVERAAQYVALQLNRPTDVAHPASVDQKAFLVAALSAASPSSQARIQAQALYEQDRARLSNGGRAYLLLALHALAGGTASASPAPSDPTRALLNDLAAATIPSANGNHWEDPAEQRAPFLTNTSTTGLVSVALARVAPEHALFPQTIRWLVVARSGSEWKTNIDRALGMLGLSAYAVTTRELGASFRYRVTLDDEEILAGLAQPGAPATAERTIPLTDLTLGAMDQLAFERELGGPGRLYYTLDLRYVTPAHDIEALNRGFAISHAYSLLDDPTKSVTSAKLGDVVRVTMTIVASADRSYVTVEDMLPAGLEAIDARLANVDPALKAKLEDERRAAAGRREGAFFAPWYRWYYSPWQQVDLRDDRTVLRADALPKGVYEYVYYARATAAGRFFVAPAHADETYFPEVFGRSDSSHFTIEP